MEIHRTLAHSHLLWRQQILAVEQLQVPVGISLVTAVVVGEEFTYKQISLFEPRVTILTNRECTEMFLLNSEDAPVAKICMTQSPGGSQLTESLLITALEMLYSIPIPSHNPLPPCRSSVQVGICSMLFCGLPTRDLGAAGINGLLLT